MKSSLPLRNFDNINEGWGEILGWFVESIKHRPDRINTAAVLKGIQMDCDKYPLFVLKGEIIDVLFTLGAQALQETCSPELIRGIKLPYEITYIAYEIPIYGHTAPGLLKQHELLFLLENEFEKELLASGATRALVREGGATKWAVDFHGVMAKIPLEPTSTIPLLERSVAVVIEDRDRDSMKDEQTVTSGAALSIGLCIALNSKQVCESELIRPKPYVRNIKGSVRQVKPSAYHKLTLTLRGQEYAQYLKDKAEGPKKKGATPRCHWCRGHFKLRRGKLCWWSAHLRSSKSKTVLAKDYTVIAQ